MQKGYKFRLYPNKTQQKQLETMFKAKSFVWNHFLKLNMDRFEVKEKLFTYNQMSKLLTELKQQEPWLYECEKSVLQNTLKDLGRRSGNPLYFNREMKASVSQET